MFSSLLGQIFCEDMDDYELGEALRGDITDNPLEIYMRVSESVGGGGWGEGWGGVC